MEQLAQGNFQSCLFQKFPPGALRDGFSKFQPSSWKQPVGLTVLVVLYQKDVVLLQKHHCNTNSRVFLVHRLTFIKKGYAGTVSGISCKLF